MVIFTVHRTALKNDKLTTVSTIQLVARHLEHSLHCKGHQSALNTCLPDQTKDSFISNLSIYLGSVFDGISAIIKMTQRNDFVMIKHIG